MVGRVILNAPVDTGGLGIVRPTIDVQKTFFFGSGIMPLQERADGGE